MHIWGLSTSAINIGDHAFPLSYGVFFAEIPFPIQPTIHPIAARRVGIGS